MAKEKDVSILNGCQIANLSTNYLPRNITNATCSKKDGIYKIYFEISEQVDEVTKEGYLVPTDRKIKLSVADLTDRQLDDILAQAKKHQGKHLWSLSDLHGAQTLNLARSKLVQVIEKFEHMSFCLDDTISHELKYKDLRTILDATEPGQLKPIVQNFGFVYKEPEGKLLSWQEGPKDGPLARTESQDSGCVLLGHNPETETAPNANLASVHTIAIPIVSKSSYCVV